MNRNGSARLRGAMVGCLLGLALTVLSGCSGMRQPDVSQRVATDRVMVPSQIEAEDGWGATVNDIQCRIAKATCRRVSSDGAGWVGDVLIEAVLEFRNVGQRKLCVPFRLSNPFEREAPETSAMHGMRFYVGGGLEALGHRWCMTWEKSNGFLGVPAGETVTVQWQEWVHARSWPGPLAVFRVEISSVYGEPLWHGKMSTGRYCLINDIPVGPAIEVCIPRP